MKKYKVHSRKVVYSKGPITLVDCDVSTTGGKRLSRQILEHPGAVVIIPRLPSGKLILVKQFRFAAREWLWEFPAGGIERGENLERAASRELMEEAGYRPRRLKKVLSFFPTPGICAEVMYLYLADGLVPETALQDEDEEIETGEFTLGQIGKMIKTGKIRDAKTIIGYFYLKNPKSFS
jgi:ADP-ribose pyrophosphatase